MVSVHPASISIILLYDGLQLIGVLHLFTPLVTGNWQTANTERGGVNTNRGISKNVFDDCID